MKRGGKFLVSTTMFAVAACGGQPGKLEIRSSPTPLAQLERAVPERIAEARGQLALGNVGLALTSFRIAAREDPNSTDALAGIAACYDRMGRFDLSRRHYEAALALAPSDVDLLGAFAASLQLQGNTEEALNVRQEIAARSAAATRLDNEQLAAAEPTPAPAPPMQFAAAERAPAPAPVAPARSVEPAPVKPAPPAPVAEIPEAAPAEPPRTKVVPKPAIRAEVRVAAVEPKAAPVAAPEPVVRTAELGPSVTVKLPPVRRVQEAPSPESEVNVPTRTTWATAEPWVAATPIPTQQLPVDVSPEFASVALLRPIEERIPEPVVIEERGPRIERMSMGEIALITVSKPVWRSTTVAVSQRSTKVRFVPLRQASIKSAKVRLLNAARVNKLAARTRTWLNARGWRGLAIGNAQATRKRSVILYPATQRALAQRLSAQFGFPLSRRASGSHIVVLLGSDAARLRALQPRRA